MFDYYNSILKFNSTQQSQPMAKNTNKTQLTEDAVSAFLDKKATDPVLRQDCQTIISIMEKVTGQLAKMWGTAIVGCDSYHYKYDSGREGDMCLIGFSPRSGKISLYVLCNFDGKEELLAKLGKHAVQGSCLHIKKLSDIDLSVLEEICVHAADYMRSVHRH